MCVVVHLHYNAYCVCGKMFTAHKWGYNRNLYQRRCSDENIIFFKCFLNVVEVGYHSINQVFSCAFLPAVYYFIFKLNVRGAEVFQ